MYLLPCGELSYVVALRSETGLLTQLVSVPVFVVQKVMQGS
jgi:hypothetical protein